MGLIYGEFPETAARLILSAALRKLPQLAKREMKILPQEKIGM